MKDRLSHEEFVRLAIEKLRLDNYKGIHTVYSGFNEAFRAYFGGENPIETTDRLAAEGKIGLRPVKGGVMIFPPGEGAQLGRGDMALKKMGLLEEDQGRPPGRRSV